jgi:hypothetical protein
MAQLQQIQSFSRHAAICLDHQLLQLQSRHSARKTNFSVHPFGHLTWNEFPAEAETGQFARWRQGSKNYKLALPLGARIFIPKSQPGCESAGDRC